MGSCRRASGVGTMEGLRWDKVNPPTQPEDRPRRTRDLQGSGQLAPAALSREREGLAGPKSYSQHLQVQVETSDKRSPSGVHTGINNLFTNTEDGGIKHKLSQAVGDTKPS